MWYSSLGHYSHAIRDPDHNLYMQRYQGKILFVIDDESATSVAVSWNQCSGDHTLKILISGRVYMFLIVFLNIQDTSHKCSSTDLFYGIGIAPSCRHVVAAGVIILNFWPLWCRKHWTCLFSLANKYSCFLYVQINCNCLYTKFNMTSTSGMMLKYLGCLSHVLFHLIAIYYLFLF